MGIAWIFWFIFFHCLWFSKRQFFGSIKGNASIGQIPHWKIIFLIVCFFPYFLGRRDMKNEYIIVWRETWPLDASFRFNPLMMTTKTTMTTTTPMMMIKMMKMMVKGWLFKCCVWSVPFMWESEHWDQV